MGAGAVRAAAPSRSNLSFLGLPWPRRTHCPRTICPPRLTAVVVALAGHVLSHTGRAAKRLHAACW
eukprot:10895033-Alexandrium_andersonii.AAC.1